MPSLNAEARQPHVLAPYRLAPETPRPPRNWFDIAHAAIYTEFLGGNIADRWGEMTARWDGEDEALDLFSPYMQQRFPELQDQEWRYFGVRNEEELAWRILNVQREEAAREILDEGGWAAFWTTMGAAVLSPENLLPIGYFAKAGKGIWGAAKGGAKGGAIGAGAGEVGLQALQHEREALVSAASVAGSAAFGLVLGGAIGAIRPQGRRLLQRQLRLLMEDPLHRVEDFTASGKARIREQDIVPRVKRAVKRVKVSRPLRRMREQLPRGEEVRTRLRTARARVDELLAAGAQHVRARAAEGTQVGRAKRITAMDLREATAPEKLPTPEPPTDEDVDFANFQLERVEHLHRQGDREQIDFIIESTREGGEPEMATVLEQRLDELDRQDLAAREAEAEDSTFGVREREEPPGAQRQRKPVVAQEDLEFQLRQEQEAEDFGGSRLDEAIEAIAREEADPWRNMTPEQIRRRDAQWQRLIERERAEKDAKDRLEIAKQAARERGQRVPPAPEARQPAAPGRPEEIAAEPVQADLRLDEELAQATTELREAETQYATLQEERAELALDLQREAKRELKNARARHRRAIKKLDDLTYERADAVGRGEEAAEVAEEKWFKTRDKVLIEQGLVYAAQRQLDLAILAQRVAESHRLPLGVSREIAEIDTQLANAAKLPREKVAALRVRRRNLLGPSGEPGALAEEFDRLARRRAAQEELDRRMSKRPLHESGPSLQPYAAVKGRATDELMLGGLGGGPEVGRTQWDRKQLLTQRESLRNKIRLWERDGRTDKVEELWGELQRVEMALGNVGDRWRIHSGRGVVTDQPVEQIDLVKPVRQDQVRAEMLAAHDRRVESEYPELGPAELPTEAIAARIARGEIEPRELETLDPETSAMLWERINDRIEFLSGSRYPELEARADDVPDDLADGIEESAVEALAEDIGVDPDVVRDVWTGHDTIPLEEELMQNLTARPKGREPGGRGTAEDEMLATIERRRATARELEEREAAIAEASKVRGFRREPVKGGPVAGGSGRPRYPGTTGEPPPPAIAEKIMKDRIVKILGLPDRIVRKVMRWCPKLRMLLSDVDEARFMIQLLTDTGVEFERFSQGYAAFFSAEDAIGVRWKAREIHLLSVARRRMMEDIKAINGGKVPKGELGTAFAAFGAGIREGRSGLRFGPRAWSERVARAMRNGDVDSGVRGPLKGVEATAREIRKLFDDALTDMVSLGMIPARVRKEFAKSYFTRVWDIDQLTARKDEWIATTRDLLMREPEMKLEDATELAQQMHAHIVDGPEGRLDYDVFQSRTTRVTHERRIPGTDQDWDRAGFLVNDIDAVLRYWFRTIAPDIELAKIDAFLTPPNVQMREGWKPDPSLRGNLARARTQAIEKAAAELGPGSKEYAERMGQIQQAFGTNDAPGDLHAIVQLLRNTYGIPKNPNSSLVQASVALRSFNYLVDGGTFWLSSLPDLMRPIMVAGTRRVWGTGIRNLIQDWETVKLNGDEALLAGTAADLIQNRRVREGYDLEGYGHGGKAVRLTRRLADDFSTVNGLAIHNTYIKRWAATIMGQRIVDFSQIVATRLDHTGQEVSERTFKEAIHELARVKIDREIAERIWLEVRDKPLSPSGRLRVLDTVRWRDSYAREVFRASLRSSVDATINTPKIGDRPLLMSRELGRFIFQYKSFAFASTMQTLVPGLQRMSQSWAIGASIGIGLGIASTYLKAVAGGFENKLPDIRTEYGLMWHIRNGVDRAGFTGIMADVNSWMGYATRGRFYPGGLLPGGEDWSYRYGGRNVISETLGPSVSTMQDFGKLTGGLYGLMVRGEQPARRHWNALKRNIITQNHFLLNRTMWQPLIDASERKMRLGFPKLKTTRGFPTHEVVPLEEGVL